MTPLQSELKRLYDLPVPDNGLPPALITGQGRVQALVMALARPADWALLARVWRGVQADLGLPAPAIAVSGTDSLQLWFSLQQAAPVLQAQNFLEALRIRYLSDVAPQRVSLMATVTTSGGPEAAASVPARQAGTDHWSAFVAPDLAPIFDETPWLDLPPNEEGQAQLLRPLHSITGPAWTEVLATLLATGGAEGAPLATAPAVAAPCQLASPELSAGQGPGARQFLQAVMHNDAAPLALRIEAAKALLPYDDTSSH
jgi:hypothetical protein